MISPTFQTPSPNSLAMVPYACPHPKKRVKKEPAVEIAKTLLVDSSPLSSPPSVPLDKDRVKSLSNKSDLGDLFDDPFDPDDDCMSLAEKDLENLSNKSDLSDLGDFFGKNQKDDCMNLTEKDLDKLSYKDLGGSKEDIDEETKAKLESDTKAFLGDKHIKFKTLLLSFETWTNLLKEYANYSQILLKASEYITDNKENIVNFIKLVSPDEAPTIDLFLDMFDDIFKWADSSVPFLTHFIHGIALYRFHRQAEEIKQSAVQLMKEHEGLSNSASSSANGLLNSHYSIHHFQSNTVGKEWKEVKKKGGLKFARLVSKVAAVIFVHLGTLGLKTANRVTKSGYEVVKTSVETWECYNMNLKQKEWLFHLQPYLLVNIEPENPTVEEEEALEEEAYAREDLIEEVRDFLLALDRSKSIEEVEALFKKINLPLPFVLPPTIGKFKEMLENPRCGRDLVQCYYYHVGRRASISASKLSYAIDKKEEEHNRKVDYCFPFIIEHIDECKRQKLSFAEVQKYFKKQHIDISSITIPDADDLPIPPTDELEWEACIQNEDFIRAAAEKWVDFQEATAQMAMQALRQALLSKHNVERKFLLFRAVEIGVGFISTALQLYLCNPQIKLSTFNSVMEILITDITKWGFPGFGAFYLGSPLYPGMKFKIEALFMQLAKHFFAIAYKPNEYSLEGYQLTLKLRWTKLVMLYYTLQFILQKAVLWLNIRLVDDCIKRQTPKSLAEDKRYDDLAEEYDLFSVTKEGEIRNLENALWELQVKDANLIINPQSQKTSAHFGPSDPIKDLADALIEADIEYFPPLVIEFFENQVNFKLSNDNKAELEEHLKDFFAKSGDKFLSSYFSKRFDYLKS